MRLLCLERSKLTSAFARGRSQVALGAVRGARLVRMQIVLLQLAASRSHLTELRHASRCVGARVPRVGLVLFLLGPFLG